jgi:site-specific recombinase XerD
MNGLRSIRRIKIACNHLRAYFGGRKARSIDDDAIMAYKRCRQEQQAANASINQELAWLRKAFNLCRKKVGYVPKFTLLPLRNRRTGFFEREQFEALLAELPDYLKPVAQTAYITGWRVPSEILTRRTEHVEFRLGRVAALRLDPHEAKSGEPRRFPATPELMAVLAAQVDSARRLGSEWLFHHRDGSRIKDFRTAWQGACDRARIDRIPHDFRRTAVRSLASAGVAREVAMQIVGHKTPSIYARYFIVDQKLQDQAAAKLAAFHQAEAEAAAGADVIAFPKAANE